ncbi:hypothetical protein PLICRDRAFT_45304 [Plicaturopsis crispa FD-325 SS-3]|uniref:Zn(2)-C6 fungal-type domain-containing protein n=1 Tax=Plicaturopsis crispa FD-325 SS-3 TaxID=944288 RepID=A0A0C9TA41_PLICR|nr:hypothetical protein PLICRDRAFT_45304 [Plicaturopsis crispa FD-325 SS-3]
MSTKSLVQGPQMSAQTHDTTKARSTSGARRAVRQGFRRSKDGCLNCKRFHSKCDEGLPECLRCRQSKRKCEWPEHVRAKLAASAEGLPSVDPTTSTVMSTAVAASPLLAGTRMEGARSFTAPWTSTYCQPTDPIAMAYPDPQERRLIVHFVREAPSILTGIPIHPQNVLFLDLSRVMSDRGFGLSADALRLSLLSIGALHQAWLENSNDEASTDLCLTSRSVANHLQLAADSCLKAAVLLSLTSTSESDDTLLMATTMLYLFQVLSASQRKREHMETARNLVQRRGGPAQILESAMGASSYTSVRKLLECLAVFDMFDALGSGKEPALLASDGEMDPWWYDCVENSEQVDSVECAFGVSRGVLEMLARTVRLVSLARRAALFGYSPLSDNEELINELELFEAASQLEEELQFWTTTAAAEGGHKRKRSGNLIYIETAKILLACNVCGLPREDPRVQASATLILELSKECNTHLGLVLYLMWPLLVAGAQVDGDQRWLALSVLEVFSTRSGSTRLGPWYDSCNAARGVLQTIWNRVDNHLPHSGFQDVAIEMGVQFL